MTEQTKEVFRMRMKQYRERNEMVEKQKQQREWRMMEMKQRMNSIVNNLDPVSGDTDTIKTESRCGIFFCHFLYFNYTVYFQMCSAEGGRVSGVPAGDDGSHLAV